jgi:sugar phosphate isomerase/epimerase
MPVGINVAALRWEGDFSALPGIARRCTADGVEFPVQLWQLRGVSPDVLEQLPVWSLSGLLSRTHVIPESVLAEVAIWEAQRALLSSKCAVAVALGRPAFAMCIDPWSKLPRRAALSTFIERVQYCADIASRHGLGINLEYVSHRVARANGESATHLFCGSLADARQLLREIGVSGVKLLLDLIHWYADGCSEGLSSVAPEVGLVHLADHRFTDADRMSDAERLYPFEGGLPVERFIAELRAGGYAGPMIIETFGGDGDLEPRLAKAVTKVRIAGG